MLKVSVFWDVIPCCLAGSYQCFGGICCFHLLGRGVRHAWKQLYRLGGKGRSFEQSGRYVENSARKITPFQMHSGWKKLWFWVNRWEIKAIRGHKVRIWWWPSESSRSSVSFYPYHFSTLCILLYHEDGGKRFSWNVSVDVSDHTVSHTMNLHNHHGENPKSYK